MFLVTHLGPETDPVRVFFFVFPISYVVTISNRMKKKKTKVASDHNG